MPSTVQPARSSSVSWPSGAMSTRSACIQWSMISLAAARRARIARSCGSIAKPPTPRPRTVAWNTRPPCWTRTMSAGWIAEVSTGRAATRGSLRIRGDVDPATRPRSRLHDRRRRRAVPGEAVDDLLEVLDVAHVRGHDEAVLAGDPVALDDLGRAPRELRGAGELHRRRAQADERAERIAQSPRVDLGAIARDHLLGLQAAQALRHRRRGETDAAAELGQRQARVLLQLGEQPPVGGVDRTIFGGSRDRPCVRRHVADSSSDRPFREPSSRTIVSGMSWRRPPPHAYFIVSAVFHYLGPAFAVLLFARVDVLGVAWLRI